jgi:hypothetical protein
MGYPQLAGDPSQACGLTRRYRRAAIRLTKAKERMRASRALIESEWVCDDGTAAADAACGGLRDIARLTISAKAVPRPLCRVGALLAS